MTFFVTNWILCIVSPPLIHVNTQKEKEKAQQHERQIKLQATIDGYRIQTVIEREDCLILIKNRIGNRIEEYRHPCDCG